MEQLISKNNYKKSDNVLNNMKKNVIRLQIVKAQLFDILWPQTSILEFV